MSVLQVQAEWAAVVEIILLLIWAICFTLKSFLSGIASAAELEVLSWPIALTSFILKIIIISIHICLALFLHWAAKQRDEPRLKTWLFLRLFLGLFVLTFLVLDIFYTLSISGITVYSFFLLSLYVCWALFIFYSLVVVKWLLDEIQQDLRMARAMYTLYSGRSPD